MGDLSPEQHCLPLSPHGQVHQSVLGEVLAPTEGLPKILEPRGELGAGDPLARGKQEKWKSGEVIAQAVKQI